MPTPDAPDAAPNRLDTLQAGLDLLDQGITVFDADLRMVAWNRAFLRLLGFPPELAYVGAPFESFMRFNAERGEYGEPDEPHEAQIAQRMEAARQFTPHDLERMRPDGRVLRVRGEPLPGHGFVTTYSDVTDQRRAEREILDRNVELEVRVSARTHELQAINERLQAASAENEAIAASLQRSEAQMRLITDSIPALIAYFDAQRRYRYINRGYRDWFGLDPQHPEAVRANAYLGDATHERVRPYIARALAGESVTFEYDLRLVSGQMVLARTSLIPERAADGNVIGCFELTFDITEQKRSHEMLVQAQKMEALGHLTGGLAHDFNNILTVIIGNLSALADARPGDALTSEFVDPAVQAARRGAELIKGLLSFSRQQALEEQAVDVAVQIHAVQRLVRRSLPESLQLAIDTGEAPLWAWTDPNLLQNTLLNLLLNARDATALRSQGAEVRITACAATQAGNALAPLPLAEGRYVRLDVSDNGVGMDEATRRRVFEPFFTTKRPGLGTGLGLAMVHDFVRQSGGAIDIASTPGEGTRVSIWLPMAEVEGSSEADPPADDADQPAAPSRGLALLVEDEPQVRRVVRRQLLQLGYAVIEADTGAEALPILAQMPNIALLLTDVVMPGGVDGRDLARHARDHRQVPLVVLMSGYAPGELVADDIPMLAKPFTRGQLARFLEAHRP
ncbi:PAS-domain containing protein [Ideonella sp.]|uniref:PAS-domain containing protein n=1 Tax=Ideonella sp. TaxID=1929293 RepID=UPI003BB4CA47